MAELGEAAVTFTTSDSWDSCIDTIEEFYRKGWTDGLPVIPPTPDLIERMVERCGRDPQEVLGPVPPRMGLATVETVAANAVMAGCRPDYFPVVLAVVEAALDARFNLNGLQATTHPAGPLVIISGPVVKDLDINFGTSAFGPGFRSNATIGRALRLVMMVLGGGYPETGDKSVLGSPGKYIYCIGESPDAPWGPLHGDFGVDSPSGVTLLGCDSPVQYGGAGTPTSPCWTWSTRSRSAGTRSAAGAKCSSSSTPLWRRAYTTPAGRSGPSASTFTSRHGYR